MGVFKSIMQGFVLVIVFYTVGFVCAPIFPAEDLKIHLTKKSVECFTSHMVAQLDILKAHTKNNKRSIAHKYQVSIKKLSNSNSDSVVVGELLKVSFVPTYGQFAISGCYADIITPPPSVL